MLIQYPNHRFDRGGNTAGSDALAILGTTLAGGLADPSLAQLKNDGSEQWDQIDSLNAQTVDVNNWDDFDKLYNDRKKLNQNNSYKDFMMSDAELGVGIAGAGANGIIQGMSGGGGIFSKLISSAAMGVGGTAGAGLLAASQRVKANNLAAQLNQEAKAANELMDRKIENAALNLNYQDSFNALRNLKAFGGNIDSNFTNGVRTIDGGGTHEQNPLGGVPQGIASDGLPNLVEEDEVIYDDYVFSNRLKVPEKVKQDMKLTGKNLTFADAAKKIQKESEERPNDMISNNGLKALMGRLQQEQETLKQKKEEQRLLRQFAKGGLLGHKYGLGDRLYDKYIERQTDYNKRHPDNKKDILTREAWDIKRQESWNNILRSAPIFGNASAALMSAIDSPDYSNINSFQNKVDSIREVSPKYITQKMTYNPIDPYSVINQANNIALGNRRAIIENGAAPGAMTNAVMADAYTDQVNQGQAAQAARQYNDELLGRVLAFNRDTDSTNADMNMKAQQLNQGRDARIADAYKYIAGMRNAERDATQQGRSAAFTSLFDSIGNFGKDRQNKDIAGVTTANSGVPLNDVIAAFYDLWNATNKKAFGGNLKTKKKGGKHA